MSPDETLIVPRWASDESSVHAGPFWSSAELLGHARVAGAPYTFEMMKEQFIETNKSGKGLAGPEADTELELPEFLGLLVRVCFHRLNPEYGEVTMEYQSELLPVPQCLRTALDESILQVARRDDAAAFRTDVMTLPGVKGALYETRARLQRWFLEFATADTDTGDGEPRVTLDGCARPCTRAPARTPARTPSRAPARAPALVHVRTHVRRVCRCASQVGETARAHGRWIGALDGLQGIGTFVCERTSDIVGDERAGDLLRCRLSLSQAKAAFANAQT